MSLMQAARSEQVSRRLRGLSTEGRAGLKGLSWAGSAQVVGLSIRLLSNVVLARFLAPGDYGLLGSAMAVLTTLDWLSDIGITPALIRNPRGSDLAYLMTGWWMGLWRGLCLSFVAAMVAVPYGDFARQPGLTSVLLALAVKPIISALRSPGMPAVRKALNYRGVFVEEVAQTVVGTAVSLVMAWTLHSVWALVAGTLSGAIASVLASYRVAPVAPRLVWNRQAASEIGHLGRQVFWNTLVMAVWLNADRVIGLRYIPLKQMGLYAVAWNLAAVAEGLVSRACDVYFSMLSRRGDGASQLVWHRRVCRRVTHLLIPLGGLAVALAIPAVWLLYDPRYAAAGPLLAILLARLLARALGQMDFQFLMARAQVGLATRANLAAAAIEVALLFALLPHYGVTGLALAAFGSAAALTFVQSSLLFLWLRQEEAKG